MDEQERMHRAFMHDSYLFRRKVFKLFGGAFHVYDEFDQVVLYSEQKAFRLKEDFSLYSDETRAEELLTIKTPQILDVGATYYVDAPHSGERVGALRRKWLSSLARDTWKFLDPNEQEIGTLTESSTGRAILCRLIKPVPQRYFIRTEDGQHVAEVKQHFNPLVLKYTMTIEEREPPIDRRLLVASGVLLAAIERRQK